MKLDINIFRGWDIIPSSLAYVFIKSPISSLLTKVFLKIGGKLAILLSIFQVLQNRTAGSQITFLPLSLQKLLSCKWTPLRKVFSDILFNSIGCFTQSPPFALPHFKNFLAFLLYIVSSQCIELSLLATTLNILFSERDGQLLTGTEVVKELPNTVLQWKQNPSTLKQSISFFLPVVKKLSISHSGLVRWKKDMTVFSKLRVLFCRGVNLLVS